MLLVQQKIAHGQDIVVKRAENILRKRCFHCHGKNGVAEGNVYVLDRDRLVREQMVIAGQPRRSRLVQVVVNKSMPIDMEGGLPASEIMALRLWVEAGAPALPSTPRGRARIFVSDAQIVRAIQDDLELRRDRYRKYYRYFSIVHLYNAGVSDDELEGYRLALSKLLNSLSWNRGIAIPIPIDDAKALFRIDIRDYSWTASTFRQLEAAYPYKYQPPGSAAIQRLSGARAPYLRADWFVAAASIPPLYHRLLGLPHRVSELEARLGVDARRNLDEEKNVLRAGIRNSGVSKHNRVVERHVSSFGAYWKSFDFNSSTGKQNIFKDPLGFVAAGGEMIFNLPNGLQGYMIADAYGRRIDEAPVAIVSDNTDRSDPVVRNGRSCIACHFEGIKQGFPNDVHTMLGSISQASFDLEKARAIYLSRHAIKKRMVEDAQRFQMAVEATGGALSSRATTEPIYVLSKKFWVDLPIALAAAELGLRPKQLSERISGSTELIELGLGQLLGRDGAIKREAWESSFIRIAETLGYSTRVGQD